MYRLFTVLYIVQAYSSNLMEIVQNEQESNFENLKKKARDFLLSIIGSIEEATPVHSEAVNQLVKGGTALKHTFESLLLITSVIDTPPIVVPNNKNIDQQRRFFSTTKRQKKGNIRFPSQAMKTEMNF